MKIAIGSDHAGYQLKQHVIDYLEKQQIECVDFGARDSVTPDSYVPFAAAVAYAIQSRDCEFGIVICGTGIGISIAANKHKGIRAALCTNEYMARMAREHNNANVLALGGRVVGPALALSILDAFLAADFDDGGRHRGRVNEIDAIGCE